MGKGRKYSTWILAFLFAVGLIIAYKTVDNFNFIFDFFGKVLSAMTPFISGFIIAYLLNLPIRHMQTILLKSQNGFLEKHVKGISILLVYILVMLFLTVLLRLVVPAVYQNVMDLYYSIPYYFDLIIQQITQWQNKLGINLINIDKQSMIDAMQKFFTNIQLSEFGKYAQGIINATSSVISVFISVIISVYMLIDKNYIGDRIKRVMSAFLPEQHVIRTLSYIARINDIFSKYIFSVVLDGLTIGILSTVVMSLLRVKYAIILGTMIGVLNLIPYFGAIIAVVLSIIVTLLTGGWLKGLWVGILLLVLQQIDSNLIGPKIMGNMLKVRPLMIIFAVTIGGGLFGVWGMVLSVPVSIVLKMIFEDYIIAREEKNRTKDE